MAIQHRKFEIEFHAATIRMFPFNSKAEKCNLKISGGLAEFVLQICSKVFLLSRAFTLACPSRRREPALKQTEYFAWRHIARAILLYDMASNRFVCPIPNQES
jgi:hypothetical protein